VNSAPTMAMSDGTHKPFDSPRKCTEEKRSPVPLASVYTSTLDDASELHSDSKRTANRETAERPLMSLVEREAEPVSDSDPLSYHIA
jgi:hypothetical protein